MSASLHANGRPSSPAESGALGRWRAPLLLAVLLVGAILRIVAVDHHRAIGHDEGRYLDNAVNILKGRGLATHDTSRFLRPVEQAPPVHPEELSSPLYPYLLAVTFALSGAELRPAQLWSLAPGCLMIWLTFLLGERLFDQRSALLASVLVALNPEMVILSSWAMTESLHGALLLAILLLLLRAEEARLPASAGPWIRAALGIACGALCLLRASGVAAAVSLGLALLLPGGREEGARRWPRRLGQAALFGVCFLAAISPRLVRDHLTFGSPVHTAMRDLGWSENGLGLLARGAARAAGCLVWGDTGGYNLICALFPVALVVTWRARRLRAGHLCVLLSTVLLIGVPLSSGALSRSMLPLRPWIYLSVVGAALQAAPALAWRRNMRRAADAGGETSLSIEPMRRLSAAAAASLAALVVLGSTRPLREFMASDEQARDLAAREAALWIAGQTAPDAVLMDGACIHQYAFLHDRAVVRGPAGGLDEVRSAAVDSGARYLVVSEEQIGIRPELGEHFGAAPDEGVRARDLPDGFEEVFAGAGRKVVIWKLPAEAA